MTICLVTLLCRLTVWHCHYRIVGKHVDATIKCQKPVALSLSRKPKHRVVVLYVVVVESPPTLIPKCTAAYSMGSPLDSEHGIVSPGTPFGSVVKCWPRLEVSPLPIDFQVLHNDPVDPKDHCGRFRIRTGTSGTLPMSHHISSMAITSFKWTITSQNQWATKSPQ